MPSLNKKSQNLMMSVFCSNTLIFAPECWKCILVGPDFKNFPETQAFAGSFFPLHLLQSFCHLLKILLKTLSQAKPYLVKPSKWIIFSFICCSSPVIQHCAICASRVGKRHPLPSSDMSSA